MLAGATGSVIEGVQEQELLQNDAELEPAEIVDKHIEIENKVESIKEIFDTDKF